MDTTAQAVQLAEDVLSKKLGGRQKITEAKVLSGAGSSIVLRARLAASPFLQARTVIIKYAPDTADTLAAASLVREIIAYQFTTSLPEEVRPGPMVYAFDVDNRLVVISDSGEARTYAELLEQARGEERIGILRALGQAVGRMHVVTTTHEDEFEVLMARMVKKYPDSTSAQAMKDLLPVLAVRDGLGLLEQSGLAIPERVHEIVGTATERLQNSAARAFTPLDLAPDNIIYSRGTHFLDYEWASFRDVVFDIAGIACGFPQYLFSRPLSDEETDTVISAWIGEISGTWPRAKDEVYISRRIASGMLAWAVGFLSFYAHGSMDEYFKVALAEGEFSTVTTDVFADIVAASDTHLTHLVLAKLAGAWGSLLRFMVRSNNPAHAEVIPFVEEVAGRIHQLVAAHSGPVETAD
ncbi:MAG: phosphotransferase [Corynebacterium sp.]|nr:phosphotransferase [Corynebacterium sp.]